MSCPLDYDGVVVGIQFVDDTRYLCPDFDLCDRLDCPGCRDGFRDISPYSLSRFDNIVALFDFPPKQNQSMAMATMVDTVAMMIFFDFIFR